MPTQNTLPFPNDTRYLVVSTKFKEILPGTELTLEQFRHCSYSFAQLHLNNAGGLEYDGDVILVPVDSAAAQAHIDDAIQLLDDARNLPLTSWMEPHKILHIARDLLIRLDTSTDGFLLEYVPNSHHDKASGRTVDRYDASLTYDWGDKQVEASADNPTLAANYVLQAVVDLIEKAYGHLRPIEETR
jgi:hypothetical protein